MSARRPWWIAAIAVLLVLVAPRGHAADGPPAAWWSRANVGLVPSAGEPGVGDDQFLVQGASASEDGWLAVAAFSFPLDGPVADATLALAPADRVDGSAPPVLCALTKPFEAAHGGAWQDVPAHDCAEVVTATVTDDGRLVFTGVGGLARDGAIQALVVPGGPGRYVFDRPAADALAVTPAHEPTTRSELATGAAHVSPPLPSTAPLVQADASSPAPPGTKVTPSSSGATSSTPAVAARRTSSDLKARFVTAAILAVLLGGFTAMQRGGGRLRPSRVPWLRTETAS